MPTLEALDALKKTINELGDEPRILAERGEALSDVAPPEAPTDPDLERLLDESSESSSGDGVDEMEALLGAYSEDLDEMSDSGAESMETIEAGDFALDDLAPPEGLEEPTRSEDLGMEAAEEDSAESPADLEDFSLDDLDFGEAEAGFGEAEELDAAAGMEGPEGAEEGPASDLSGAEGIGSEGFGEEAAEPEEEAGDSAELDEDFSLDDLDFGEEETGFEEPSQSGDLEDLGDLGEIGVPGEDEAEPISEFDASPEETAASPEEPGGEADFGEDFSLDDLDFDEEEPGLDAAEPEDVGAPLAEEEGPADTGAFEDLGDLGELEDLEDLGNLGDLGDLGTEGPEETAEFEPEGMPAGEAAPEVGDLEELADLEGTEGAAEEMPDIESAMEDLGDLDSLDEESGDELSLNDDLNFEEELGADALADITDIDDDTQQFSMEDFGEQYNFKEGEDGFADNLGVDLEKLEQSLDEAAEEEEKPFGIEEEDLDAILLTLASLPRNLKMALEELLADERRSPEDLQPLIDALIDGESPKELAAKFKAITKRSIKLPRSYEKRSGRALEARQAALAYRLIKEGWPVIRMVLLVIAVAWAAAAALFMWVYRPLKADQLYRAGLEAVSEDDVDGAVTLFHDAWDGWPLIAPPEDGDDRIADAPIVVKGWKDNSRWLDYARAFRRRKHWNSARYFYEGYLAVKPGSKDERLEYAGFLSRVLGRYGDAVDVLESAPDAGGRSPDRDYTLAIGDVYLDWAEDDPSKYEEARFRYAKVLETSRNDERAILSMMRYHLRLEDDEEIETLLPIFDSEVPGKTDESELAAEVYADLGMYHLARGNGEESRRFINLAIAANPGAPEPHYADARYWEIFGDESRELEADRRTLIGLDGRESLSRDDIEMRILTLGSMGRIHFARASRETADPSRAAEDRGIATRSYSKAVALYEDALARNQVGASPKYGKLYLELGDILYGGVSGADDLVFSLAPKSELVRPGSDRFEELDQAVKYYDEAEAVYGGDSGGSGLPAESLYRRAYARYSLDRRGATVDFHRVVRLRPEDYEARLALAASLLRSGDYEASRSQYARAIELLDDELRRTGGELNPEERRSHEELLIRYVVAWNNLGVGRARSAARGGGEDDFAAALSAFTMSSEYSDEVYEDMDALAARGLTPLRDLNDRRIMSVSGDDERNLLEEKSTYPYRNRLRLLGLETAETGEDAFLAYEDIPSDLIGRR